MKKLLWNVFRGACAVGAAGFLFLVIWAFVRGPEQHQNPEKVGGSWEENYVHVIDVDEKLPLPSATDKKVTIVVANPETGEVSGKDVSVDGIEDGLRAVFGIPSKKVEEATRQVVPAEEVGKLKVRKCLYIQNFNTPGYLDPKGEIWNGISYDGGVFPLLEEAEGFVKTIDRSGEGEFVVTYFRKGALTANSKETAWTLNDGPTVQPEVEQCRKKVVKK